jgi:hypothetical protein
MGLKSKLKEVVGGMSNTQKVVTVVIAVLIPIGAWFGIGAPTDSIAVGSLVAAEIAAVVVSLGTIFELTPVA